MNLIGLSCFIPAPVPLAGPPWKMRRKRRLGPAQTFPLGGGEPHRTGGRCQMATNTSGGRREGQLQYLQYIESNTMELKICRTQTTKGAGAGWLALKTIQDPKFGTDSQVLKHSQSISCSQISNSVEVCDSAGAPTFRPIFKSQCWQSPISSIFVAFSWPRHFLPTFKFQDVLEVILGC